MRDIELLLAEANEQMSAIRELYAESLRAEEVAPGLPPKIKNVLENQRSALEYVAHEIVERFGKKGSRCYFPIVIDPVDFVDRFNRNMAGVAAARPDIRDAIEQYQPYNGHQWLGHLATLTNENKHQKLTPQTRVEATELRGGPGGGVIGKEGGAQIRMGPGAGIVMGSGATIEFGGEGPVTEHNILRTILVDWIFADPRVSALGLLETIQRELPTVVAKISHVAGL